jgi:hypothetical protein
MGRSRESDRERGRRREGTNEQMRERGGRVGEENGLERV